MDIKTGLAIYNQPWLIEPTAALRMLAYWEKVLSKEASWDYNQIRALEKSDDDAPVVSSFKFKQEAYRNEVVLSPTSRYEMREFKGFEGARVAVIPVSGVVMKNDYCGDFGTQSLKAMVQLADQAKSVETIVFLIDSPGGTVDGTQVFANAIKDSTKTTVGIISGMCCSAAYWIGSSADELYATGNTDIIGSIGTMMAWMDNSKMLENMGLQPVEVYATKSAEKNAKFNEAMDGKPKRLIKTHLDPMNDVFLNAVQENRKGKIDTDNEDVLSGDTYIGHSAVENGLIDGILSFESIISKVLSNNSASTKTKTYTMSKPTLAFGAVLIAAKALELPVVEGGFLLTEEQLNNIDAKLDQDEVTARATASQLKTLQEQSEAFTTAATTASDLVTAKERIKTLEAELAAANGKITAMGKEPGAEMATTTKEDDPKADAPVVTKAPDSFEKMAAMLNP